MGLNLWNLWNLCVEDGRPAGGKLGRVSAANGRARPRAGARDERPRREAGPTVPRDILIRSPSRTHSFIVTHGDSMTYKKARPGELDFTIIGGVVQMSVAGSEASIVRSPGFSRSEPPDPERVRTGGGTPNAILSAGFEPRPSIQVRSMPSMPSMW